ncbi:hypothetical protein SISSUDRAFT_1063833 [Sistotremastrum suecicum HHB10207 ss-3]|uniref:PIH1 N-terminal domain-containing protein n=1 Tax=Sistotremastrum suecicum HHB10207 ss-3 TaxID=1314776 RepID=A0A166BDD0_9AGAM|nr:hypothetical protein SISSUDRAFT_1063833 [Sistotremastrum suecicum HHB10207 ss-3]
MAFRKVSLKPDAGFCIKTTLESTSTKIFLNICYSSLVPFPPMGLEPSAIEDPNYVLPIVISELREDKDKKGEKAFVVDCIYSKELKGKVLKEPDFKEFLQLIALEKVEERHELILSRKIGTPNIASKGKLLEREATVPVFAASSPSLSANVPVSTAVSSHRTDLPPKSVLKKPLIEELTPSPIPSSQAPSALPHTLSWNLEAPSPSSDGLIKLTISVPNLTKQDFQHTTLDVEPYRVILRIGEPPIYELDQDFQGQVARQFKVEQAGAEWRVAEKRIILTL